MDVLVDPDEVQAKTFHWKREGVRIGLVPTMGFLHEGHLSLIRIAREKADKVVLSLFVNPTQFGPDEDLDRYPTSVERDLECCRKEGVDMVFMPKPHAMYAEDSSVSIVEKSLSRGLCGLSRPVHFGGVLTVVAKLFNICLPDIAVFGEKDAQQIRLIRRMVRDLNFPVEILSGPIVREEDGVAMSSRNANLSPEARAQAPWIRKSLLAVEEGVLAGERDVEKLKTQAKQVLSKATLGELDYLEFVDDETLVPVDKVAESRILVAIAVQFPGARLIDNIVITNASN